MQNSSEAKTATLTGAIEAAGHTPETLAEHIGTTAGELLAASITVDQMFHADELGVDYEHFLPGASK